MRRARTIGGDHVGQLTPGYLRRSFQIITDQLKPLVVISLGEAHVGLADSFVFWNQRFKTVGPYVDEDFAAVPRIAHALDELSLLEAVENVRDRSSRKAGMPEREPAVI